MFKKSIAVLSILVCVSSLNLYCKQSDEAKLKQVDEKIAEYQKEKSNGITYTCIGVGAMALSLAFIPTTTFDDNYNVKTSGSSALFNVLMWGGFIAGSIGGYMWYDGVSGLKVWESKRIDVSMGILSPESISCKNITGIGLTAKF